MTMAQALVRYLAAQRIDTEPGEAALFAGVFTIFGHGNVAGLGEALAAVPDGLPVFRGHNEQSMAHIATAFAKAKNRRQVMACTTSIGPGATNLVTAAAAAHVNRLPLLLLPGDVFASRRPDPVLQQLEDFASPAVSVNDCLRPVSRLWDRLWRPEQLLDALPKAVRVLTDPALCGPVTLALPQDTQTEAYDYPADFFTPTVHRVRRPQPDRRELAQAVETLRAARRPLIIAGGGVHYSLAGAALADFASSHRVPVAETQAGKGALPWAHPQNVGGLGVTGTAAANALASAADVVLAVGTRLSDFTTGSRALFADPALRLIGLNAAAFDAAKHAGLPLVADAREALTALHAGLDGWRADAGWTDRARREKEAWDRAAAEITRDHGRSLPTDAEVLGAVNRLATATDVVVCAAGGLPGELHKLWRVPAPGGYHVEYGYSCMGYEVAGGLGVKMAHPEREVFVLVGDGSYLMLNSELVTAAAEGLKITVVLLDNHGFGCIHRLQQATGGAPFRSLLADRAGRPPRIEFAAHARALGAEAELVKGIPALEEALGRARRAAGPYVIVIETDPACGTAEGGAWWDVAVPEVSERAEVLAARRAYEKHRASQRITGA
jgi:3D-(3,5/4)-trihydroxycyclohexane-1,2-dione acylhydrolase (decyclizing)